MNTSTDFLRNRFGAFDTEGRSFTITDPRTPAPWVNVISNGRLGLIISQNGGGFSWLDDAQHNVLTRWQMDLVLDSCGKFLYLADRDSGQVWSIAPAPCGTRHDEYACTHEPGVTTFRTLAHDIRSEWTLTVDPEKNVEVWLVRLTNMSNRPRRLRVASYFEWCCGVAPDSKREFHRLFLATRHDPSRRAILATKTMWDIPPKREKDHWNQPWPYVAAHAVGGITFEADFAVGDKSLFVSRYGSFATPSAMLAPSPLVGGFGRHSDACGALGGDLMLPPGQTASFFYLIACDESEEAVTDLLDSFLDPARAESAERQARESWTRRLSRTHVSSARTDFNLLNNTWLPYQAISGRLWGRTGYYQQSGAFGFRDQLQDSQVWLALDPGRTLDQILLHATRQFTDGTVNHWWHPLANFGNHTACSDDYLWLPFVTASYLRETDDFGALERLVPFLDDPVPATLLEHCRRSFARAFARLSPRGLPLIGSCDWNDGLSALGVEGQGESVWLGLFLCHLLSDWATIHDRLNDHASAEKLRARRAALAHAINAHAWDGAWYRYGTKDNGEWIGASSCREGQIHLNAQTWAILTDVAPRDRARACWESVKANLLTPYGPLLLAPAYTTPDENIGYITRYAPGARENGGVYMHAATWALMAAAKLRDVGMVQLIWDSISPPWRGRNAEGYGAEPYVMPGNVDGPATPTPGRAAWTWYTGSAAWLNRVSMEWILGIRPAWDGLAIDPVPLPSLGLVRVRRMWRGTEVRVRFDSREFSPSRRARVFVGDEEMAEGIIRVELAQARRSAGLDVEVTWSQTPARAVVPAVVGRAQP
jgi:cellobiose phosphorylase